MTPLKEKGMVAISTLFGDVRYMKSGGKVVEEKAGLRGYFYNKLAPSWTGVHPLDHGHLALRMQHLTKLSDYYYLKSICDKAELEGGSFAKTFWGALKIKRQGKNF